MQTLHVNRLKHHDVIIKLCYCNLACFVFPQGMTTSSTTTAPDTRFEMLNENQNVLNSENINTQHNTHNGNGSDLNEDSRITVTKELFLCRICYSCDQIERFVNNAFLSCSIQIYTKQCHNIS